MPLSSGLPGFWWEICCLLPFIAPSAKVSFLLLFQPSSLFFRSSIMLCLGMNFFVFINSLGFYQLLESVSICLLPDLGNVQPLFLRKKPFSPILIFSSEMSVAQMRFFGYCLTGPWGFCSLLSVHALCFPGGQISIFLFGFTDFFPLFSLFCCWIYWVFYFSYCNFQI